MQSGFWGSPPSRFYALLGQIGVAIFFMITGYLFWTKMLKDKGRPSWISLYVGRVFRIAPLYCFAIAWMLVLVFAKTGFHLYEPAGHVLREAAQWSLFGLFPAINVNQYADTSHLIASVTWTLRYEWSFYFSLVVTAFAVRKVRNGLLFTIPALIVVSAYAEFYAGLRNVAPWPICAELFLIGMTCASLEERRLLAKVPNSPASMVVVGLLVALFLGYPNLNLAIPCLLMGVIFFLIVSGCNLFGLLTSLPARRLGNVSYGIYILQGLVLTCVFGIHPVARFALSSPASYWIVILGCGVALVATATVAHVLIERPGIDLGKRLGPKKLVSGDRAASVGTGS